MCVQMCGELTSVSQNNTFEMLWFGEDISKNFDSQKEERAHQEAVLDSSLLKNEILALTRAQLTPSPCLISIICEKVAIGVIKKKINVLSQWACLECFILRPSKPGYSVRSPEFRSRILYLYP